MIRQRYPDDNPGKVATCRRPKIKDVKGFIKTASGAVLPPSIAVLPLERYYRAYYRAYYRLRKYFWNPEDPKR